jgi:amino acid adenylation domain-containing protein
MVDRADPLAPSIVSAFERVVESGPDRSAISGCDESWTYGELNGRANGIASVLREFGPSREAWVGLELPRGPWLVAAVFGILKAGCAYLPLDPSYPPARRDFLLEDAGCELLVAPASSSQDDPVPTVRRLDSGEPATRPVPAGGKDLGLDIGPNDLAYMIYTSGSTGRPKGVLLEHGGVVVLVSSLNRFFSEAGIPIERQYQFFNITFDATIWEIFLTLLSGREMFIDRPGPTTREPDDLLDMLDEHDVDCLMTTPSFLGRATPRDRPALRTIIVCGEPCPLSLADAWAGRHRIINAYGPTETTCVVTVGEFRAGESTVSIGPPLDHVTIEIVDGDGDQVDRGEIGEIWIGGPSVARGYNRRPELKAFPSSTQSAGRTYRSGDLGYERPDGSLEFVGRVDHQVKIRGFRVEPAEIEARLEELPWVSSAVVVPFGPQSRRSLAAYLVGSEDTGSVEEARAHLRALLPSYMVPLLIEVVREIPLLPSGKTDRKCLAEEAARHLDESSNGSQAADDAGDLRSSVAAIWTQALGVQVVSDGDDFFELGGHSAIAPGVVKRAEGLVDRPVPLRLLFANPTLATFVAALEGLGAD